MEGKVFVQTLCMCHVLAGLTAPSAAYSSSLRRWYPGANATVRWELPEIHGIEIVKCYDNNRNNIINIVDSQAVLQPGFKDKGQKFIGQVIQSTFELTILNVTFEDAGTFKCRKTDYSEKNTIFVWGTPSPAMIGKEGRNFTCEVKSTSLPEDARPPMTYIWLQDGKAIGNATYESNVAINTNLAPFPNLTCRGSEEGSVFESESGNVYRLPDHLLSLVHRLIIAGISLLAIGLLVLLLFCCPHKKKHPASQASSTEEPYAPGRYDVDGYLQPRPVHDNTLETCIIEAPGALSRYDDDGNLESTTEVNLIGNPLPGGKFGLHVYAEIQPTLLELTAPIPVGILSNNQYTQTYGMNESLFLHGSNEEEHGVDYNYINS